MKKISIIILSLLFMHGTGNAQVYVPKDTVSDIFLDSTQYAFSLDVLGFNIGDTSENYYCGYYSGNNFKIGANLGIGGIIVLACMGKEGHVDLNHPERTTAFLGKPNVTPGITLT